MHDRGNTYLPILGLELGRSEQSSQPAAYGLDHLTCLELFEPPNGMVIVVCEWYVPLANRFIQRLGTIVNTSLSRPRSDLRPPDGLKKCRSPEIGDRIG